MKEQFESQSQGPARTVKEQNSLILFCIILLLLVAASVGYFLWLMNHAPSQASVTLRILDRSEWKGEPPIGARPHLSTPVPNVIICHTATEGCNSEDICVYRTRLIQSFHMQSFGWPDIGYNFLVGGDGQVYVGRGWHVQGQHTKGYNAISISIAFIGTFTNVVPPPAQVEAAKQLMEEGLRLHKLHTDYRVYAHRQLSPTESPGGRLYDMIQHWPRWSQEVGAMHRLNNEPLRFVSRDSWLAQPAMQPLKNLSLPVQQVRFVNTRTERCTTQAECTFRVRSLQTVHLEGQQWADINYNFLVGGDGNVYVGRGWQYSCEARPEGAAEELVVAFVGEAQPDKGQMEIAHALLAQGVHLGHMTKDYKLVDRI